MNRKFNVINISPPNSAIQKCGANIYNTMLKNYNNLYDVNYIDLYPKLSKNKIKFSAQLYTGLKFDSDFGDVNFYTSPLLSNSMTNNTTNIVLFHDLYSLKSSSTAEKVMCKILFKNSVTADVLLANSLYTLKEVVDYYDIKMPNHNIIYLGVDSIFKTKPIKSKNSKLTFLSVGRDEPRKNLKFTLELLYTLKNRNVDFNFIRVGDMTQDNLSLLNEFNLLKNTTIKSNITEKELVEQYDKSDFLLMPSFSEGFGLPVIEAMCRGCIPITSNKGSLPEINYKELCCDLDISEFIKTIEYYYIEHPELMCNFKIMFKDYTNKFSWDNYCDKLIKVIRK